MDEQDLICKIKDIIIDLYNCIFVGDMKIEKVEDGYILSLFTSKDWLSPQVKMYIQCSTEEEFLDKVKCELYHRQLHLVNYFTGEKLHFNDYKKRRFEERKNSENQPTYF